MRWLLITKQKRLKGKILKEFKRHPKEFDVIEDYRQCILGDVSMYSRIIIGDDYWKIYIKSKKWKTQIGELYWDLRRKERKEGFQLDVVSQCSKCKRKGIRLNRTMDGRCKECRKLSAKNHNAEIVEEDPDWIEEMERIEPDKVTILNKRVPEELGRITQEIIDNYFPEFKGINIRLTTSANGKSLDAWHIALNPDILDNHEQSRRHTVAHELTHQMKRLQGVLRGRSEEVAYLYNQQIPHGELQCEIWTFARHPDFVANSYFWVKMSKKEAEEWKKKHGGYTKDYVREVHAKDLRHFIKHKDKIHELSKEALVKRKEGMINYRAWFRNEMKKIGIIGSDGYS